MSDFLSRLAGRTIGLTPSVQPLITPMYAHRPTPVGEQSGLVPFDSDISGAVPLDGDANASIQAWDGPDSFATRDIHQAFGRPQGHAPTGGFPDNPLMAQADRHQGIDGDRALPLLQEEYVEKTRKNHPLPHDGSASSHPFNAASQHDLGPAPTFRPDHPTSASSSVTHKDRASIPAQETILHRRGVPLWPPSGSEQTQRADRKDESHKDPLFAHDDHNLPLNELPPSNGSLPSSGEFFQAGISMQDSSPSQRAGTGTSPYGQPSQFFAENIDNRGDGSSSQQRTLLTEDMSVHRQPYAKDAHEEHTPLQDWAALLPGQKVPGAEASRLTDLKRGNLGGITQQMGQNETPPTGTTTPSIQVTIGRIEVRATPPPPPTRSPAQRTAPSVMSLDDYVNQRMKGGG